MGIHQTTDPNGCLLDDVQAEKHRMASPFSHTIAGLFIITNHTFLFHVSLLTITCLEEH